MFQTTNQSRFKWQKKVSTYPKKKAQPKTMRHHPKKKVYSSNQLTAPDICHVCATRFNSQMWVEGFYLCNVASPIATPIA